VLVPMRVLPVRVEAWGFGAEVDVEAARWSVKSWRTNKFPARLPSIAADWPVPRDMEKGDAVDAVDPVVPPRMVPRVGSRLCAHGGFLCLFGRGDAALAWVGPTRGRFGVARQGCG